MPTNPHIQYRVPLSVYTVDLEKVFLAQWDIQTAITNQLLIMLTTQTKTSLSFSRPTLLYKQKHFTAFLPYLQSLAYILNEQQCGLIKNACCALSLGDQLSHLAPSTMADNKSPCSRPLPGCLAASATLTPHLSLSPSLSLRLPVQPPVVFTPDHQ